MNSAYVYATLPSTLQKPIRLLRLFPDNDSLAPLIGEIEVHDLASAPHYQAISYVWGSDHKSGLFETSQGAVDLTKSLHSTLTRIRRRSGYDLLWADGICINQADTTEKALQVGYMRDIFHSASCVLVDLGPFDASKSKNIAELAKTTGPVFMKWFPMLSVMESRLSDGGVPGITHPGWAGHQDLILHPWFRRAWILQEFVVAKDVTMLLGLESIDWAGIFGIVHFGAVFFRDALGEDIGIWHRRFLPGVQNIGFMALQRKFFMNGDRFDLSVYMEHLWFFSATHPRDKFFAFKGIAKDSDIAALRADYHSPISMIAQTFGQYFLWREGLSVLSFAGLCEAEPAMPSWAPCLLPSGPRVGLSLNRGPHPDSLKRSLQDFRFSDDSKYLIVIGRILTRIRDIDAFVSKQPSHHWLIRFLGGLVRIAFPEHLHDPFTPDVLTALLHTTFANILRLQADNLPLGELVEHGRDFIEEVVGLISALEPQSPIDDRAWKAQALERSDAFINHVPMISLMYNPCLTDDDLPGIVPVEAENTDVIADFIGDNGLYVLRPTRKGTYRLIGECYAPSVGDTDTIMDRGHLGELCIW